MRTATEFYTAAAVVRALGSTDGQVARGGSMGVPETGGNADVPENNAR